MSRTSSSLDLSEFFNNDESDVNRLAEFLQKRQGGVQRPNFLFMNCEPQRFSINVQLEKLPTSQQPTKLYETNAQEQVNAVENCRMEDAVDKDIQEITVENQIDFLHGDSVGVAPNTCTYNLQDNEIPSAVPSVQNALNNSFSPSSPVRPKSPFTTHIPSNNSNVLKPLSPRLASIRKSGGAISSSDRLRRYSLKRLTKMCAGRRTLLREFESTTVSDTNFDPPVCSTPLSQTPTTKTDVMPTISPPANSENCEPNTISPENISSANELCCGHTDTLIRTLQRKDEELQKYMESVLENTLKKIKEKGSDSATNLSRTNETKSPLKRTYTVEKGDIPGQVIFTLDKSISGDCQQKILSGTSQILKITERSKNCSMPLIRNNSRMLRRLNSTQITNVCRSSSQIEKNSQQPIKSTDFEKPINPPPPNNISIIFPNQDNKISETQKQTPTKVNSITIKSDNQGIPVVVIPVNHTLNGTEHILNNKIIARTKQSIKDKDEEKNKQKNEKSEKKYDQLSEDNLKLTDILTDDDEDTSKAAAYRTVENDSQAPLNLATSETNGRIKRLRKRSISRRILQVDKSQMLSNEAEPPPQAHTTRRIFKRRYIPLNKAPGTPLNGEEFAQELARMSNYEILDLRKRNSMGHVFAISGRRSSRLLENAVKKQHELDDKIKMELMRRNIELETDEQQADTNTSLLDEESENEYPPVPDKFRDEYRESSLVDERPSDRISFKKKINSSKPLLSKGNHKHIPEVLKQYLEVSKRISRNKKSKRRSYLSKRSLYTHGNSDSEGSSSSQEKSTLEEKQKLVSPKKKKQSIPYVPSPPKLVAPDITTLKVVSPPPPLSITPRKSPKQQQHTVDVVICETEENAIEDPLPPPPPGFESDSGVSSNNFNFHSNTTVNTIQKTNKVANNNNSIITNTTLHFNNPPTNFKAIETNASDEHLFKKPQHPAPRKRVQKAKRSETPSKTCSIADTTDGSSLRRSKRQVPIKNSIPIFQMLFQENFNRRMQLMQKRQQKEKEKLREVTRANKTSNTNKNNAIETASSQKISKTAKSSRKHTKLPAVLEDESIMASLQQDIEILQSKKKAPKIKEPKIKRKQNKKTKNEKNKNDNFECSHITLNKPPPVEHLNIVFDQLRNTSSTHISSGAAAVKSIAASTEPTSDLEKNVKQFKVRVARLKSTAKPSSSVSERDAYSCANSTTSTASSSFMSSNLKSNYELISWLRNISESDGTVACNEAIFKEMRISAASNLSFTELQGIEYAFYDTDEKASLGYLRFKPRQIKPKKKAKRFHLHFVTLVGNFRVTANDKVSYIGVGDMVAIEKSVYYDIENITDDIGILMVIKK